MVIEVVLSSGETDRWTAESGKGLDAVVDKGYLIVVLAAQVKSRSACITPEGLYEEYNPPTSRGDGPKVVELEGLAGKFELRAMYAPGMWMKVVFS